MRELRERNISGREQRSPIRTYIQRRSLLIISQPLGATRLEVVSSGAAELSVLGSGGGAGFAAFGFGFLAFGLLRLGDGRFRALGR